MASSQEEKRDRADRLLVRLGHFESRASARAAIEAGLVTANGALVAKPSQAISADDRIEATRAHPYVSRGGLKLAHALDTFGVSPKGRVCLDIGSSTGGFTDVLLRRGAAHVVAVDVGRDQLHPSLGESPNVASLEGTDARALSSREVSEPPSLVVCDASFIALEKLMERPLSLAAPGADAILLFKPQFQVGRAFVGRGGIVTDPAAVEQAENLFEDWLDGQGWSITERTDSPIKGGDGNAERLLHAIRSTS